MADSYPGARVAVHVTGPLQENTVLVWDDAGSGFLVDPGDEAGALAAWVEGLGVRVEAIVLTHGHFDHVGAVQVLRDRWGVPVLAHTGALEQVRAAGQSAARYGIPFTQPADPDAELRQDETLTVGSLSLTVRELFGHAPGHVVLLGDGFVIAGDTLFAGSIGRSDLPGGDHPALIAGIRRELMALPETTVVYPGHGPATSVGAERRRNPYL